MKFTSILTFKIFLVFLYSNVSGRIPSSTHEKVIAKLHHKFFANYLEWCGHLSLQPNIGHTYVEMQKDIILWLLIWGEASNLRHLPECLLYLFHKLREDCNPNLCSKIVTREEGSFLQYVITPIYEAICNTKCDIYTEKLNYDGKP